MLNEVDWHKVNGILPAVIQHIESGEVLMLGYMDREALEKTLKENIVTFYSRTRGRLWTKGETSGNFLRVKSCSLDCDKDSLLIIVDPAGPVCHRDTSSCFDKGYQPFLRELAHVIDQRFENGTGKSYVKNLHTKGACRIAQKVGEEGVEVALAGVKGDRPEIAEETADLLFHLMVNLRFHNIELEDVINILKMRGEK